MTFERIFSLIAAAAMLAAAIAYFVAPKTHPGPTADINAAVIEPVKPVVAEEVFENAAIIKRESDGHYWATASVDGTSVKFMIDTGASTVALTFRDAQRLGLKPETLDYRWKINTAGGETKGASVLLPYIRIGQVEVENVEAMILREGLSQSLLGMTFLGELYSYEFKKKQLIIRQ